MIDVELRNGDSEEKVAYLTTKEAKILAYLAEGKTSKQIAEIMSISQRTVEAHKYNMITRTRANNIMQVVVAAVRKGLI